LVIITALNSSAQHRDPCGNKSIPLDYADEAVEETILRMLGTSERLERVQGSGSDHSAELADINETLTDLTGLLGSGAYRAGTPQRIKLNKRISGLAARQAELSTETVKPAGWTWQPTGEKFADWWDRQDTTARNIWLRSMNIRMDFKCRLVVPRGSGCWPGPFASTHTNQQRIHHV